MRQIVLDTETTGLNPDLGHRIVEIGCIELINRRITQRKLHFYLNPERTIDSEALSIHGLTEGFLSKSPKFSEICHEFLSFIKNSELIAHNAGFDTKFLNSELKRMNLNPLDNYCEIVDSLSYARKIHPGKKNSLDALCERYRIPNNHRTFHGALLDSFLLAKVWIHMTRGQDSLLIEDEESGNSHVSSENAKMSEVKLNLTVLEANSEELNMHRNYLKNLQRSGRIYAWWDLI